MSSSHTDFTLLTWSYLQFSFKMKLEIRIKIVITNYQVRQFMGWRIIRWSLRSKRCIIILSDHELSTLVISFYCLVNCLLDKRTSNCLVLEILSSPETIENNSHAVECKIFIWVGKNTRTSIVSVRARYERCTRNMNGNIARLLRESAFCMRRHNYRQQSSV